MPFYFRKSVSLGPIRFNLSKSGIGMSAGIPGLRVGTGPRGNYIHMGKGGLYYRQSLPSVFGRQQPLPSTRSHSSPQPISSALPPSTPATGVLNMVPESDREFL